MAPLLFVVIMAGVMVIIGVLYFACLPLMETLDNPTIASQPMTKVSEVISERTGSDSMAAAAKNRAETNKLPVGIPYDQMTDDQKIRYVLDVYFTGDRERVHAIDAKKSADDEYIASLDQSPPDPGTIEEANCKDDFDECPKWAANDECTINPSFMLYSCRKSCASCKMTEQEKFNLVKIYNERPAKHCVEHEPYPDRYMYLRAFENINSGSILQ